MIDQYQKQFQSFIGDNKSNQSWFDDVRKSSMESFAKLGFPSSKHEAWKHTDLSIFRKEFFPKATVHKNQATSETWKQYLPQNISLENFQYLVFQDGVLAHQHIVDSHLKIESLSTVFQGENDEVASIISEMKPRIEHPFFDLNNAFVTEGLYIKSTGQMNLPLLILYVDSHQDNKAYYFKNIYLAEKNSSLDVIEYHSSNTGNQTSVNIVSQVYAKENAHIEHVKIQNQSKQSFHQSFFCAVTEKNAVVKDFSFTLGSTFSRNDVDLLLKGEGAQGYMYGLYSGVDHQHQDHHTLVDHSVPHCESFQLYKGVLDDDSHAVFEGRVIVREDAQKIHAQQMNRNLLLSQNALVDTTPQLEIFADDVKCTHGATIGKMDEEQVFYLRSRGIEEKQARNLLVRAFVSETISSKLKPFVIGVFGDRYQDE